MVCRGGYSGGEIQMNVKHATANPETNSEQAAQLSSAMFNGEGWHIYSNRRDACSTRGEHGRDARATTEGQFIIYGVRRLRKKCAILRNEPILFSGLFRCIDFIYKGLRRLQSRLQMGSFPKNEPILEWMSGTCLWLLGFGCCGKYSVRRLVRFPCVQDRAYQARLQRRFVSNMCFYQTNPPFFGWKSGVK